MEASRNSALKTIDSLRQVAAGLHQDVLHLTADTLICGETLRDRNLKIEELATKLASLRDDLATLTSNYDEMKSNSGKATQDLIAKLEKTQKDLASRDQRLRDAEQKLKFRDSVMTVLRKSISDALLGFKDSELSVTMKNGKVYVSLSNQLLFASGSTEIDKRGKSALKDLADALNKQQDITILVEGHTDNAPVINLGHIKDNWDLSVLRSTEVIRFLASDGEVDPKRIIASGRSEYFSVEAGSKPENRAKNRRTEIILTPKLDELFDLIK